MKDSELQTYLDMMKLGEGGLYGTFIRTKDWEQLVKSRKTTRAEQLKQDLIHGKIYWQTPVKEEKVSLLPSFVNISIKADI